MRASLAARALLLLAVVGCAVTPCAAQAVSAASAGMVLRTDLGVAFTTPKGYHSSSNRQRPEIAYAAVGPAEGKVSPTIHLSVRPAKAAKLPKGFAQAMAKGLEKKFPPQARLRVVAVGETQVSGAPAAVLSATFTLRGQRLRNCQIATSRGGKMYVFTFTSAEAAFEKRVTAFFSLLESVHWLA